MHKTSFFCWEKIMSEKIGKAHRGRVGRWRTGRGREWCDQVLWVLSSTLVQLGAGGVQTTLVHSVPPAQSQVLEVATWPAPDRHQLWWWPERWGPPWPSCSTPGCCCCSWPWWWSRWPWWRAAWVLLTAAEMALTFVIFLQPPMSEVSRAQDRSFFILSLFPSDPITTNNNIVGSSWSALVNNWTLMIVNASWESIRQKQEIAPGGTRKPLITETDNFYNKILTQTMHFLWQNARFLISKSQWQLKT